MNDYTKSIVSIVLQNRNYHDLIKSTEKEKKELADVEAKAEKMKANIERKNATAVTSKEQIFKNIINKKLNISVSEDVQIIKPGQLKIIFNFSSFNDYEEYVDDKK